MEIVGAILAAGLGTRLRPVTDHCPKPLVPVGGVPLLEYGIDALAAAGVRHLGINLFHLADRIPPALAHRPETIEFVTEPVLAGTGGGLRGIAARLPRSTLLCANGDALFDFDLRAALAAHRAQGAQAATLVLRRPRPEETFGRVGVDGDGQIQRIAEVEGLAPHRPDLTFGVYTGVRRSSSRPSSMPCRRRASATCCGPPTGRVCWPATGSGRSGSRTTRCGWTWATRSACWRPRRRCWPARGRPRRGCPPRTRGACASTPPRTIEAGARLEGPCAVLAGAHVEAGARVGPNTVVDRGARVAAGADLEGVLVWPGVTVEGRTSGNG